MLDIKKLLARMLNWTKAPFIIRSVMVYGNSQNSSTAITAPTVNGYTFVCWVSTNSYGWVGCVYPEHADRATTRLWCPSFNQSGTNRAMQGWALYVKTSA